MMRIVMHVEHHRWHSPRLGYELGVAVFGHYGPPMLAFPTSHGDEWELQRNGLTGALADFVDAGRVKIFCVGSNNSDSFMNRSAHPSHRSWRQRLFDEYIRDEVVPFIQFPPTARMAVPLPLALLVFFLFLGMGIKRQGFGSYMKATLVPSGVPKSLYVLVVPIEFFSTFLMRPFSLAVRLFANMLAGHLLLVTFALLTAALFTKSVMVVLLPLPFAMLLAVTVFEVLVAVLQAFIFTILAAVYIGEAMNPQH